MAWPYEFLTLSSSEKHQRRLALDHYAAIAHYSALLPALLILLFRLAARVRRSLSGGYAEVPNSPALKASRLSWGARAARSVRVVGWWLGEEVEGLGMRWGRRDEWVYGVAWMGWLLMLCVLGTGRDYLHLTKRFGIIAASQMPIQYLLALKYLNPFALLCNTSHEAVNRFHRVLGRLIFLLLILHALFYNVFFVQSGIWLTRFFAPVVFAGVVAFALFVALNTTAMVRVREWSYRVFFVVHLAAAIVIPAVLYFHHPGLQLFVVESFIVFVVDLAARKMTTVTAPASVEAIPGTDLLRVSATLHASTAARYVARPGSHLYLNIPPSARPASTAGYLFEFLYNPFTVAAVDSSSGAITLVARARTGPMTTRLAQLASSTVPLCLEGPYGAAGKTLADLVNSGASQVLVVAGGVGATFAVPVYAALQDQMPGARVQLVWAMRQAGDATWAGKSVIDDPHVQMFLTGDMGVSGSGEASSGDDGIPLQPLTAGPSKKRPDFARIVDDVFKHSGDEFVAVLVCGPDGMARDLRRAVGPWVYRGRKVWWHNESFGW